MRKIIFYTFLVVNFCFSQTPTTADPEFYNNIGTTEVLNNTSNVVYDMLLQPDGKIVLGGAFSQYNGKTSYRIARINIDGSRDNTFNNINSGAEMEAISSISAQSDGKIIIGGAFTHYDETLTFYNRILRLDNNGLKDNSFNIGTGFNDYVAKVLVLENDKILVVGNFTSYNGNPANRIARLNSDGSFDTTFIANIGANNIIKDMAIQPDGKIIISGDFTSYDGIPNKNLIRINSDGTLDSSFSVGIGFQTYNSYNCTVSDITLQPDGKIIARGNFSLFNNSSQNGLVRLNSDGTKDMSFTVGTGVQSESNNYGATSSKTWLLPNGKIFVEVPSGVSPTFGTYNGVLTKGSVLLNNDGSIDTSFNLDSRFITNIESLLTLSNGKILLGGFSSFDGEQEFLTKINFDGSRDLNFNSGYNFNEYVNDSVLQADGKIIIGGNFYTYNKILAGKIIRLNTNGSVDHTFNTTVGFDYKVTSTVIQNDGKILVTGSFTKYNNVPINYGVARLNIDGTLDMTFNFDTFLSYAPNSFISDKTIVSQSDGKILVGGNFTYNNVTKGLIRLNSDGSIDTTFNPGIGCNNVINKIVIQPDGKILVGGNFSSFNNVANNCLVRLNYDGSIDNSFNIGSGPSHNLINRIIYEITLQDDGKILVGGNFTSFNSTSAKRIVRLNNNGSIDNSFFQILNPIGQLSGYVSEIKIQTDGKIIIGGHDIGIQNSGIPNIARLNANGSKDVSFTGSISYLDDINTIIIQQEGKIIIGGSFIRYVDINSNTIVNRLLRVNSNGTKDTTFNNYQNGFNDTVNALAIQPNGKIIVGGDFSTYFGVQCNKIVRLNSNATIDPTFNYGLGFNNNVEAIALQSDGRSLIGGSFTTYNGNLANRIIRLNEDGTKDITFVPVIELNNEVNTISIQNDGKIVISGSFSYLYNGVIVYGIARLNIDGSLDTSFYVNPNLNINVTTSAIQSDNKIIVCGTIITSRSSIIYKAIRFNVDGTIDSSFDSNIGADNVIRALEIQQDGKILIGGDFSNYNTISTNRIIRLNADGNIDSNFNINQGFDGSVNKILLNNQKILVGGNFNNYNNILSNKLTLLNLDGSKDDEFDTSQGFNYQVKSLAIQSDGKIVVGGVFTSYNPVVASRIIRLLGTQTNLSNDNIENNIEKSFYSIYPNPAKDEFFIENLNGFSNLKVIIFDISGKMLLSQYIENEYNNIKISSLTSGIYLIKLLDNSGAFYTTKLVVE